MELKCEVQQYAWGKLGKKSAVASFAANGRPDEFCVDGTAPYAELWMGTHPNGPSKLKGPEAVSLAEHISRRPEMLGEESRKLFGNNLPYLFKVLSVNKALSIQAHPDKKHAEQLHAAHPDIYKDDNHKPEMAIALSEFEGLCGFRPLSHIQADLKAVHQLFDVVGSENANKLLAATKDDYKPALKAAFAGLMQCPKDKLAAALKSLEEEIDKKTYTTAIERLFLRLTFEFPGDVGCLVIYFLNLITLQPGEAMFLGPNLPHAYLSGDCIECMACSDNVVRAGLTPKMIDVKTLCDMLLYDCPDDGKVEEKFKFKPAVESDCSILYDAPVPDFSVAQLKAGVDGKPVKFPARKSASIVIVVDALSGRYCAYKKGQKEPYVRDAQIKKGLVLFLEAEDVLEVASDGKEGVVAYQAFC